MRDHSMMEQALEYLAPYGPDLNNGMTNHAPMAAEALCALGRADAVMPWLEGYRKLLMPRPAPQERIAHGEWRGWLGRFDRTTDWMAFFEEQLRKADWREVARKWTVALAPAICASATHGVIRVGHAVRALTESESPARIRELAEGLGYWAACYQTLPTTTDATIGAARARPRDAITRVPIVPQMQRRFTGTIVSSLEALSDFPAFAPVIDLLDTTASPAALISELTETFARVYLTNAHDTLGTIVFIHGVTSAAAVRLLLPVLSNDEARDAVRYAWQAGCGLYAAFGSRPAAEEIEAPHESPEMLIDMAIANGDEHAIKLTEACLREDALHPSAAYRAAARHAIGMLAAS